MLLFGVATLVAALQIPLILKGVAYTEDEVLGRRFLAAPALLSQLLSYMTNGLLDLPPTPALLTYAGLTLALVITTLRFMRKRHKVNAVWLIAFASFVLLSLVIAINEVLRVIAGTRIRYIMPLWPLTALLAGAGLSRLADKYRILATGMLALWLITGAWLSVATEYRYELGYFFRSDNHRVYRALIEQVPETDLLMIEKAAHEAVLRTEKRRLYSILLDQNFNAIPVDDKSLLDNIRRAWAAYPFNWLLYLSQDRALIKDLTESLGMSRCELVLKRMGLYPGAPCQIRGALCK